MSDMSWEDQVASMLRRERRHWQRKPRKPEMQWPDIMKGLSNHERMMLKKIGRSGQETRSRNRRSKLISGKA